MRYDLHSLQLECNSIQSKLDECRRSREVCAERYALETKQVERTFSLKKADLMKRLDQSNAALDKLVSTRDRICEEKRQELCVIDIEIKKIEENVENILKNKNDFNNLAKNELEEFLIKLS